MKLFPLLSTSLLLLATTATTTATIASSREDATAATKGTGKTTTTTTTSRQLQRDAAAACNSNWMYTWCPTITACQMPWEYCPPAPLSTTNVQDCVARGYGSKWCISTQTCLGMWEHCPIQTGSSGVVPDRQQQLQQQTPGVNAPPGVILIPHTFRDCMASIGYKWCSGTETCRENWETCHPLPGGGGGRRRRLRGRNNSNQNDKDQRENIK